MREKERRRNRDEKESDESREENRDTVKAIERQPEIEKETYRKKQRKRDRERKKDRKIMRRNRKIQVRGMCNRDTKIDIEVKRGINKTESNSERERGIVCYRKKLPNGEREKRNIY